MINQPASSTLKSNLPPPISINSQALVNNTGSAT